MAVEYASRPAREADHEFVISRTFRAPRARVFEAWTDPRHLARWWGPHAFTNPVCDVDARPGGSYRIVMRSPDGTDYPLRGTYLDMEVPAHLVMSMITDEHPPHWHARLRQYRHDAGSEPPQPVAIVLFDHLDRGTVVSIKVRFASSADCNAFLKMGMCEGWSQSLERLGGLLAA